MSIEDQVKKAIAALGLVAPIINLETDATGAVVAEVISATFDTMTEEERQTRVWDAITHDLSEEEILQVEYVFTRTPQEAEVA